jgi:hypothetical protein
MGFFDGADFKNAMFWFLRLHIFTEIETLSGPN